jgi:opacity protein-like surface antigen
MTYAIKAGLSVAALAAIFTAPVSAADLGGSRGSMKDGGYRSASAPSEPVYAAPVRGPAGNCYFRADAGYSFSKDPKIKWAVNNDDFNIANGTNYANGEHVSNTSMENGWLGEAGFGCGSGSRGIRAEVMFGYRGERKIDGEPVYYAGPVTAPLPNPDAVDPLHTSVKTYTMMFNAYKDLGNFGGVTPYVGAGVGLAYNRLNETYFTGNNATPNRILAHDDLAFAWSLMAGIGYQLSDRAVLDVGYRYMDMGKVTSDSIDNTRSYNPRVRIDDLVAHEIKVGIRYHFGQGAAEMPAYTPMK